jgi:hypothetical protein
MIEGLPPRHNRDRADMRDKFPDVDSEHWDKEYWHNRSMEQMALMNHVNDRRMPENLGMCTMCPSLKLLNVVTVK